MPTPSDYGVGGQISSLITAARGVVVHEQDAVATLGFSAHFDPRAAGIGAIAIPDAKAGLIRLVCNHLGRFQAC